MTQEKQVNFSRNGKKLHVLYIVATCEQSLRICGGRWALLLHMWYIHLRLKMQRPN